MLSRLTFATAALGVASLAFVGVGSYASFTSSATVNNSIKTGTFQLEALPSTFTCGTKKATVCASGPLIGDAVNGGQPVQSFNAGTEPAVPSGNTLSYSLTNANPGDTYTYQFTVYDVGTLQGQINTITYSPSGSSALAKDTTVTVQEYISGKWTDVHTASQEGADGGANGIPVTAAAVHTFKLDYSFGPSFLQPNTLNSGVETYKGEESSATYRVVFHISNAGATNALQGASAGATVSVNGTNTP